MTSELAVLGGPAVRPQGFPSWPTIDDADVEAVADVVRSGRWGGHPVPGPCTTNFATQFAALQGARHAIPMMNGTVTLEVALKALDIGWGDEVIVPAVTFAATAYAPMAAGALPVIVDVDPLTWAIDPAAVEGAITPRTRAIMPVHLGQVMSDMDRIMAIATKYQLAVVEDAAHSHGKRWRDRGAGTFGAFGSFSHQNTKILTAGEGGTLITEDERLAEIATSLIDCGRAKDTDGQRYTFGANYRMTELQAALLVSQLAKFEAQMAERQETCSHLERALRDAEIPGVRLIEIDPRVTRRSFYRYYFAVDPAEFAGTPVDIICRALQAEGIPCGPGYPGLNRDPLFQPALSRLPVAVAHADRLDVARMILPGTDLARQQAVFLSENVFRAGHEGVEDAVEAIAKVQRRASTVGRSIVARIV